VASKHDQNRAEKRERLLRAAVDAFTETGFENTTVSDVVHRAGMTPSTFYNYYRDKDALRDEMLALAAGRMLEGLAEIRSSATGMGDYFARAFRNLFRAMVVEPETAALLRRNLPLLRSLLDAKALRPVYDALRGDMETAKARGQMEPIDLDYAEAVLRSVSLEIAVVLLSSPSPDVGGAVAFLSKVLGDAFRLR
jgi:AcrR family transcriptional regulator